MARIDLRNTVVRIKDGLSGTADLNQMGIMAGDVDIDINNVALNTTVTNKVPVGARFRIAGETDADTVHTVTARTPSSSGPTTNIVFTPPLTAGTYTSGADIEFLPQRIEVKIGDGNITYTESNEYEYELDRGRLDTVRSGDDQPMQVSIDFVYEAITTGTGESIAPMDAIKRRNNAAEWVSSSDDLCEPYAVDIEVVHTPECGTKQNEVTIFPDFRAESKEVDFSEASISVSGRCNATEPIVLRGDDSY